jgi:hypothetical protein
MAAVIFLPPTLIASIHAMNFKHMPELKWLFGYPCTLGLMVIPLSCPTITSNDGSACEVCRALGPARTPFVGTPLPAVQGDLHMSDTTTNSGIAGLPSHRPHLDEKPHMWGAIAFLLVLVAGLAYVAFST